MKIGEFAKKYGVKKSTVRYYVEKNLLVPKKGEGYPEFREESYRDMEIIMRYRDMGLTVSEIGSILLRMRMDQRITKDNIDGIVSMLQRKKEELKISLKEIEHKIKNIDSHIEEISQEEDIKHPEEGVPMNLVDLLCCPMCKKEYEISKATIRGGNIIEGEFRCHCGREYEIRDEMVIQTPSGNRVEEPAQTPLREVYGIDKNRNMSSEIKNDYYSYLRDSAVGMVETFSSWDHRDGVLFLHGDMEISILGFMEGMRSDGRYYIASRFPDALERIGSILKERGLSSLCMLILYKDRLPLNNKVRYFVDLGGCAEDIIRDRRRWTLEEVRETLIELDEGLYMDFGYYGTPDEYYDVYHGMGFSKRSIGEKTVPADEVLQNHDHKKRINIKVVHFCR